VIPSHKQAQQKLRYLMTLTAFWLNGNRQYLQHTSDNYRVDLRAQYVIRAKLNLPFCSLSNATISGTLLKPNNHPSEKCLYNCCVKKFSSDRTIPLADFRCGRVSPRLTKRFSNPTTTLFQYWAVIPDIVVPIFLEKPAISPTYIGSY
jgi:hypothetical protein